MMFNIDKQQGKNWMRRASVAAELVTSAVHLGSFIADFGCGDQKMRSLLSGYRYQGFDLLPQAPDVQRFDLAADPIPSGFDAALLLGVLEYFTDIEAILRKLRDAAPRLIVSHLHPDDGAFPPTVVEEKGWLSVLPRGEFENRLRGAGWRIGAARMVGQLQIVWLADAP